MALRDRRVMVIYCGNVVAADVELSMKGDT
jgi:hypothetical protein